MPGILQYLRSFRHLAPLPDSDGELLQRFRLHRDEVAFATLVQRHGPLVLGIARRVLGQNDITEDVFQATFLVLARRGRHLETWPTVAGWLVQVARRTALQSRAKSARRSRHEHQAAAMSTSSTTTDPQQHASQRDLAELLDAELARLPSKYRTPLVLCQLQGQTKEETARQLGWPVGSVSGRLARGKKLLQDRLIRRGFVPAVVAGVFAMPRAEAQVPSLLIQATTLLATTVVHQGSKVSASVAVVLAQGVMTSMFVTKLKYAAAVLVVIALCLGTGAWAFSGMGEPAPSTVQAPKIEAKVSSLLDQLQGVWEVIEMTNGKGDSVIRNFAGKQYWIFRDHSCCASTSPYIKENQEIMMMTFQLDEAFSLCRFDYQTKAQIGNGGSQTVVGIIRIQDGILKMNVAYPGKDRPKSFESGDGAFSYTFRRASDYDRLEGIWRKEERNPVTNEVESAEELIFKKNMYVRRNYHNSFNGRTREDRPRQFLLNEAASPKQIDLEIRSVDDVFRYYNLDNPANRTFFNTNFPPKTRMLERQVGIYELKDNDFTYLISGGVPFELETDKLVPHPQSPLNKRASSFVPGKTSTEIFNGLPVTYRRVERSLKDSTGARMDTVGEPQAPLPGTVNHETPTAGQTAPSAHLTDLRQQRLKLAQERMDIWKEMFRAGLASLEASGQLSQQLLEACLALAKDNDTKVKSLEEHLNLLKQIEEYAQKGYQSGSRTKSDLLTVQLRRIEVEIQLEELKSKK